MRARTFSTGSYPALYLLHGWGEDEKGWRAQGRVDFIMDNPIAEKKAKPMLVAMDNLNAAKPGQDSSFFRTGGGPRMPAAATQPGRGNAVAAAARILAPMFLPASTARLRPGGDRPNRP